MLQRMTATMADMARMTHPGTGADVPDDLGRMLRGLEGNTRQDSN